jgi:hypothetical protein
MLREMQRTQLDVRRMVAVQQTVSELEAMDASETSRD